MSRYAIAGAVSGELLSYRGRVLVHGNPAEIVYLLPGSRVVEVIVRGEGPEANIEGRPVLPLSHHPQLVAVGIRWPLDRRQFVH